MIVLLDNGHGIETRGKRSPKFEDGRQLLEWQYCRLVVAAISDKLNSLNIENRIIVPTDHDVPLSERVEITNDYCKKESCILVSVHCNASKSCGEWGTATGWEIWTTTKKNNSDKLAECFKEEFYNIMPKDKRFRGCKEKDFFILRKANCPCVLTENFFMDTMDDCEYMLSEEGFWNIVDLHVAAIVKYINEKQ